MTDDPGTPVPPAPNYEAQLAAWGQAKIAAGADPTEVNAHIQPLIHAYRRTLGTALPEPLSGADTARGAVDETLQGLTFGAGNKLVAGARAALPHVLGGTKGFDYSGALADENTARQAFEKAHPVAAPALNIAGSILPTVATAGLLGTAAKGVGLGADAAQAAGFGEKAATKLGRIGQLARAGGTFGAVQGAASSDKLADVPRNMATQGAIGTVAAPLVSGTLGVAGNVADKTGITDAIGRAASKVGGETGNVIAQATGTPGAVNAAIAPRVALGEQLDAPAQSGQAILQAHQAETAREAAPLYDAMRADKQLLNDPDLRAILTDPKFAKPYQQIVAQRARLGEPLPQETDLSQTPTTFGSTEASDFQHLMQNPKNRAQLAALPKSLSGAATVDVPDPGALHQLKRVVQNVINRGSDSSIEMTQQEANALEPTLQKIKDILHTTSEPARLADAYYANRRGQEEALEQGLDFATKGQATQGDSSPEAVTQALGSPRYRTEPVAAQEARGAQYRTGAKASVMDQLGGKPVEDPADMLKLPILENSPQAVKARATMFQSPAEAQRFETWLTAQHANAANAPATGGGTGMAPFSPRMAVIKGIRTLLRRPDLVQSGKGQQLVGEYAQNPASALPNIAASLKGGKLVGALKQGASLVGSNALAPRLPVFGQHP